MGRADEMLNAQINNALNNGGGLAGEPLNTGAGGMNGMQGVAGVPAGNAAGTVAGGAGANVGGVQEPMQMTYETIERMYGKQETPEEKAAREQREQRTQRINNMIGLGAAIGSMLITGSSRYGRAVKSPDLSKATQEGIMSEELKRRENDKGRLEAVQKMQEQERRNRKDASDAAMKRMQYEQKERELKSKNEAQLRKEAAQQKENDRRHQEKEAELEETRRYHSGTLGNQSRNFALRERQEDRRDKWFDAGYSPYSRGVNIFGGVTGSGGRRGSSGGKVNTTSIPFDSHEGGEIRIPDEKWAKSNEWTNKLFDMAISENGEYFKELEIDSDSSADEKRSAISRYINEHPASAVTGEIIRLSGDKDMYEWWKGYSKDPNDEAEEDKEYQQASSDFG